MYIPSLLLRQMYVFGSLCNTGTGIQFAVRNRLRDSELTGLRSVRIDGHEVPLERVHVRLATGDTVPVLGISEAAPLEFPVRRTLALQADVAAALAPGRHEIAVDFTCRPFGPLQLEVRDSVCETVQTRSRIPRDATDDYTPEIIRARQEFVEEFTGTRPCHLTQFSFDPRVATGNCEHFTGAVQVPLGIAGPFHVNGEHARGDFLIPLATSEGTLVASYNRGMQALNASGGVKATVVADAMQRAPVFVLADARAGRDFVEWVAASHDRIRAEAEATSRVARLIEVDAYQVNRFVHLRFNYTTGDAAGQNMVSKATFAACSWILEHFPGIERYYLDGNLTSDKKYSHINVLRTRGKRVTAEATIPRDVLLQRLRVEPEALAAHYQVANVGAFLAGTNNNGLHAANAITAMFIATGQDVANVAESSAGIIYTETTAAGDLYLSLTLPSLIVASFGGGTGLATQRECLEMLGCYGAGGVRKLAEIVAAVALAGELSLAAAISSSEWVSSHERYGRNR